MIAWNITIVNIFMPSHVFRGENIDISFHGFISAPQSSAYLAASGLCIGSIACLAQQSTARLGNTLGLMGVGTGLAATMGSIVTDPATTAQVCFIDHHRHVWLRERS